MHFRQIRRFNVGINTTQFFCDENKISESGWINFNIKQGKSGKWYAEISKEQAQTTQPKQDERYSEDEPIVQFGEEEIPF